MFFFLDVEPIALPMRLMERPARPRLNRKGSPMSVKSILSIGIVALSVVAFGGCANTIRGVGKDTANAVDATQSAGNNIGHAASR